MSRWPKFREVFRSERAFLLEIVPWEVMVMIGLIDRMLRMKFQNAALLSIIGDGLNPRAWFQRSQCYENMKE